MIPQDLLPTFYPQFAETVLAKKVLTSARIAEAKLECDMVFRGRFDHVKDHLHGMYVAAHILDANEIQEEMRRNLHSVFFLDSDGVNAIVRTCETALANHNKKLKKLKPEQLTLCNQLLYYVRQRSEIKWRHIDRVSAVEHIKKTLVDLAISGDQKLAASVIMVLAEKTPRIVSYISSV